MASAVSAQEAALAQKAVPEATTISAAEIEAAVERETAGAFFDIASPMAHREAVPLNSSATPGQQQLSSRTRSARWNTGQSHAGREQAVSVAWQ